MANPLDQLNQMMTGGSTNNVQKTMERIAEAQSLTPDQIRNMRESGGIVFIPEANFTIQDFLEKGAALFYGTGVGRYNLTLPVKDNSTNAEGKISTWFLFVKKNGQLIRNSQGQPERIKLTESAVNLLKEIAGAEPSKDSLILFMKKVFEGGVQFRIAMQMGEGTQQRARAITGFQLYYFPADVSEEDVEDFEFDFGSDAKDDDFDKNETNEQSEETNNDQEKTN